MASTTEVSYAVAWTSELFYPMFTKATVPGPLYRMNRTNGA